MTTNGHSEKGGDHESEPWEENSPVAPEEELRILLSGIKKRVYTLKTVVEEQSREIERDLQQVSDVTINKDVCEDRDSEEDDERPF